MKENETISLYNKNGVEIHIEDVVHDPKSPFYSLVMTVETLGAAKSMQVEATLQNLHEDRSAVIENLGLKKSEPRKQKAVDTQITTTVHARLQPGEREADGFIKHYQAQGWHLAGNKVLLINDGAASGSKKEFASEMAESGLFSIYDNDPKTKQELTKLLEKFHEVTFAVHKELDKTLGADRQDGLLGSSSTITPDQAEAAFAQLKNLKAIKALKLASPGASDQIAMGGKPTKRKGKGDDGKWVSGQE